ncbi:MAG: hypothetical protein RSE20_10780 [Eubacterium sp.]
MTLSELIYKTLSDAKIEAVYESWYKQNIDKTHAIFQKMEERPQNYSDGGYEEIKHLYRFDVYANNVDDAEKMKLEIRIALEKVGFSWQGTQFEYLYEIEHYHNSQKFELLEEK